MHLTCVWAEDRNIDRLHVFLFTHNNNYNDETACMHLSPAHMGNNGSNWSGRNYNKVATRV